MANFVLVHGAWHGGWCYRDTARMLRREKPDFVTVATPSGAHLPAVIAALCDTSVDISPLVSHTYGFADFLEAFAVSQDKHHSAKVLVHCDE